VPSVKYLEMISPVYTHHSDIKNCIKAKRFKLNKEQKKIKKRRIMYGRKKLQEKKFKKRKKCTGNNNGIIARSNCIFRN
jgi:repressor of nif and glnA expression